MYLNSTLIRITITNQSRPLNQHHEESSIWSCYILSICNLSTGDQSALFTHPMTFQSLHCMSLAVPHSLPPQVLIHPTNFSHYLTHYSHLISSLISFMTSSVISSCSPPWSFHHLCLLLLFYSTSSTWSPWCPPLSPPDVFRNLLLISSVITWSPQHAPPVPPADFLHKLHLISSTLSI